MSSPLSLTFVIELPLRVNDQQSRFLTQAFEFGRTLCSATLGTVLGLCARAKSGKRRAISQGAKSAANDSLNCNALAT